jgi:hypothetical protein
MTRKVWIVWILLFSAAFADLKPSLTRIVVRYVASDLPEGESAKPKTIYLAGTVHARIEQNHGTTDNSPNLIIVNQPDIWLVDLGRKIGTHSINPGPDFTIHNPILGADCPEELFDFEFGREIEFLKSVGAKTLEPKQIGERRCETHEFEAGNYLVVVYVDAVKKLPVELKAFQDGRVKFRVEYISYDVDLPFDSSLFAPPNNVEFSEAAK